MASEKITQREIGLRDQFETEILKTKIAGEQAAQAELRDKGLMYSLRRMGRTAALAIGLITATLGVSDAVLPDDPAVLSRFPPIVSVLTNHEGDPIETVLTGVGIMVPGMVRRRKVKGGSKGRP